jgi:hypothetical protein
VLTELNRKPFKQMRWEEIWDYCSRVRHPLCDRGPRCLGFDPHRGSGDGGRLLGVGDPGHGKTMSHRPL